MPEGAPGNPGAERDAPPVRQARMRKVREMQAKLHRWAGEDSSRRFGDLFNLVYDLEFLGEAWLREPLLPQVPPVPRLPLSSLRGSDLRRGSDTPAWRES